MGKVKSSKINYAVPGREMDQKEFEQMVREAQNGPFHSLQSLKEEISKWKARHQEYNIE